MPDEKNINKYVVYLAAPLFSQAERTWNAKLRDYIYAETNYSVFLPQEEGLDMDTRSSYEICKNGIDASQIIVAVLEGADCDSGTAWEAGYGKGTGKPVIGVRTDFRKCERDNSVNTMLFCGVDFMIEEYSWDDKKLFDRIVKAIRLLLLG